MQGSVWDGKYGLQENRNSVQMDCSLKEKG